MGGELGKILGWAIKEVQENEEMGSRGSNRRQGSRGSEGK